MTTNRPTLFLMVGLPGTGKTTAARRIERQARAPHTTWRMSDEELTR